MKGYNVLRPACALALLMPSLSPAATASSADMLEEIIITSNKMAESLDKVPASIGVLTSGQLEATHAVDLQDVVNRVPGISSDFSGAPGTGSFAVRGISTGGGNSTTTGMYIDDVSINFGNFGFGGAFEPAFFDIDRVEVLRGPQGTLYGAESFGGTIRFVNTPAALDKMSAYVIAGGYDQSHGALGSSVRGAVNLPLVDEKLALRLAATYQHDGGFIDHVDPSGAKVRADTNAQILEGFRATMLWQPTDRIKVSPLFQYQFTNNKDTWTYDRTLGEYNSPRRLDEPLNDHFRLVAVTTTIDMGPHVLTAVSSYVNRELDRIQDYTIYDVGYVAPFLVSFYNPADPNAALNQINAVSDRAFHTNTNEQYSQELRLASRFPRIDVSTLFGLYFNHEARGHVSAENAAGLGAVTQQLFGAGANDSLTASFGLAPGQADLGDILYAEDSQLRFNRTAIYGEGSWEPGAKTLKGLKLTAGLRYSKITEKQFGHADGFFNNGYQPLIHAFDENQTAPKFGASYQVNDATLLYLSAAKGFRLGGQNSPLPSSCGPELQASGVNFAGSFATDSIWSYEAGTKLTLAERSVQVNASAFHIDWTGIVQGINFNVCGFGFNVNLGKAVSDGGDVSLQWRPMSGLDVDLGLAYTKARFSNSIAVAGVQAGSPIPYSPPWTGNFGLRYERPIGNASAYARADYFYTDVSRGDLYATGSNFIRPSYGTYGVSTGYKIANWDFTLYGKNLGNAHPPLQQDTGLGYYNVATLRPRQIGVEAKWSF